MNIDLLNQTANPSASCAVNASDAPSSFTEAAASPCSVTFSAADPVPGLVANSGQDSELNDVANRIGQDGAEFSTQAAPTVLERGIKSHPDRPEVEQLSQANTHLSARDLEKGAERVLILKAALPLVARNSQAMIAKALCVSEPTLSRILRDYGHLREDQITPERLAGKSRQCGVKSPWSKFAAKLDVRRKLKQLYLLTVGASSDYMAKDRRTGSASLVLERFADDEICPPELAALLRCGKFPEPLLRIIREITPEVEQQLRGPKHQALNGTLIQRRTTMEILADGTEQQIKLGDWWVFDDASDNQPFSFLGPDASALVGRQGLYAYDIMRYWLGVELIGTSRDSYTAAIILRFIRRLMQALGRPNRGVVFEQSVWKAKVISGFRLTTSGKLIEEDVERPEMSEGERNLVQHGLAAMGIEVYYTYTPRGKEIEGGFNYLQRVAPTFSPNHINIGHHAGEFEQGAKNMRRAHNQSFTPKSLGFADIDERADVLEKSMAWINNRQAWREEDKTGEPRIYPTLTPLSERDLTAFLPSTHELQIRGGKVTCTVDGDEYDFCHPELFASLGGGYRLFVKCDPGEPSLGAAIYNRETSSANFKGLPVGQYMGMAEFLPMVPRMDWRPKDERDNTASDMRKRFNKYVRTSFRAVGMPQFKAATARDGKGNVAEVTASTNGRSAAPVLAQRQAAPQPSGDAAATLQRHRNQIARQAAAANRLRDFQSSM